MINFISINEFIKNIFNQLEPFINMLNMFQKWDFLKEYMGKLKRKVKIFIQMFWEIIFNMHPHCSYFVHKNIIMDMKIVQAYSMKQLISIYEKKKLCIKKYRNFIIKVCSKFKIFPLQKWIYCNISHIFFLKNISWVYFFYL